MEHFSLSGAGRRTARFASWAVPGAMLLAVPKCPACLAAYVALWTGIGLSLPVAAGLRFGLLALCMLTLAFLGARAAWALWGPRKSSCQRDPCAACLADATWVQPDLEGR